MPPVTPVKAKHVSGKQSTHQTCDTRRTGAKQKVGMVAHQNPCITCGLCLRDKDRKTFDKI